MAARDRVRIFDQKLVSFMCGLGLVGGLMAAAGPSGPAEFSGDTSESAGEVGVPLRGETGVAEQIGLAAVGAGLVGEMGVTLRSDEEGNGEGDGDGGVPDGLQAPGDAEKAAGVLKPNLASSSVQTAKLRLTPSSPSGVPKPKLAAATSEPLASSWQRSTKLPLRTDPSSGWCLGVWGLEEGKLWRPDEKPGLVRGTGVGVWRGRLPHNDADEPEAPGGPRTPAEWRRSGRKLSPN